MSCCGKARRSVSTPSASRPTRSTSPASAQAATPATHTLMWASRRSPAGRSGGAAILHRYTGDSRLIVEGPMTGRRYFFEHPGAELAVDARDADSLIRVPALARV